eukprot:2318452-Pyramimonas_sp.AAC.1
MRAPGWHPSFGQRSGRSMCKGHRHDRPLAGLVAWLLKQASCACAPGATARVHAGCALPA